MGYWKGESKQMSEKDDDLTIEDIQKLPTFEVPERKIPKDILEYFGVKTAVSEKDGRTVNAVYFPSRDKKGKITGYKRQDLTKDKSEKYHWTTIGKVSISNKMFGQEEAEKNDRKKTFAVITEGEWDALSVYTALVEQVKGTQYEKIKPFIISIPMGTANAVESVTHNIDFVNSFNEVCIFFDNDEASQAEKKKGIMRGVEARHAVAGSLLGNGLAISTVVAPNPYKDANDMLQASLTKELGKLVQFDRKPYYPEKVVNASSISFDSLIERNTSGVYLNTFPKLSEYIDGIRLRELTLLIAPSNVGKSSCASMIAAELMDNGKIGMIFLEEENKDTLKRIMACKLKVNYLKFRKDPKSVASEEKIKELYDDIVNNERLLLLDHFGSLPVTDLLTKVKHMVLAEGCKYIFLDHISAVISGLESENERKDLDVAMTALAAFCASHDVHLFVVSHINRTDSAQFLPPKTKKDETPEPFWVNVRKESSRGSAALEQFSWNILALEPEILPDFSRGRVRWKILKTRFGDRLGIADVFSLDEDTWEVILFDEKF